MPITQQNTFLILLKFFSYLSKYEIQEIRGGFGMGFFGVGIYYFGLDRKIPKIPKPRESGSGLENSEKFRVKNPENLEIPGIEIGIGKF